jgi:hypothetical protein
LSLNQISIFIFFKLYHNFILYYENKILIFHLNRGKILKIHASFHYCRIEQQSVSSTISGQFNSNDSGGSLIHTYTFFCNITTEKKKLSRYPGILLWNEVKLACIFRILPLFKWKIRILVVSSFNFRDNWKSFYSFKVYYWGLVKL